MENKTRVWLHNVLAAVIAGGANAVLAMVGIAGADAVGAHVPELDFKQCAVVFVSGAVVGLAAYLKQSPLPPAE